MKNILFIMGNPSGVGGEARSISRLCNELVNQQMFSIDIAYLGGTYSQYQLDGHIHTFFLQNYAKGRTAKTVYLMKIIRQSDYHLIIGYGWITRLLIGIIGCLQKAPVIYCERLNPLYKDYPLSMRLQQFVGKALLRNKSAIVQSRSIIGYYSNLKRVTAIPNMIDVNALPEVAKWSARENKVINASRCISYKNHKMLVEAFIAAHRICPYYCMEIYSDGKLKEYITELIRKHNAESYIALKHPVPDILNRMNSAKIYALSSDTEGYPNTLLEAMAMGMACISTKCTGSIDDLIEDGMNGLKVPVGNTEAMADALVELMQDDNKAHALSERATAVRKSNSAKRLIAQWASFFNDVLEDKT